MSRNFGIRTGAPQARGASGKAKPKRGFAALAIAGAAIAALLYLTGAAGAEGTTPSNRGAVAKAPVTRSETTPPALGGTMTRDAMIAACAAARDALSVANAVRREFDNPIEDVGLALKVFALTAEVEWEKRRDERCGTEAR